MAIQLLSERKGKRSIHLPSAEASAMIRAQRRGPRQAADFAEC
jgi:hypothetical protein